MIAASVTLTALLSGAAGAAPAREASGTATGSSTGTAGAGQSGVDALPAVWVGAPFEGNWPGSDGCSGATFPSYSCSLPIVHWWLASPPAPAGDWAVDIRGATAGEAVYLYAAPQQEGVSITAKVEYVGAACQSANGGSQVRVAFYNGSTKVGRATYAHVVSSVSTGQTINRWGTKLGTVWSGSPSSCWTGPHVHFQLYSEANYACYNKGWRPGQVMHKSNFVGYTGGNFASGPRKACP